MKLLSHSDPLLRQPVEPVDDYTGMQTTIAQLFVAMYSNRAAGLAAPQVGMLKEIFVMHIGSMKFYCINPRIFRKWAGHGWSLERSLTGSEQNGTKRLRFKSIEIRGYNADGQAIKQKLKGKAAYVAQHCIDHLNGEIL